MPGGRTNVASPNWFEETFGCKECGYKQTQENFDFAEGVLVATKGNGKSYYVGAFETPSLEELRTRASSVAAGGLTFQNVVGNAQSLHKDEKNAGAVFQVASQFNCLEMNEPGARPEDGVNRYYNDATQGPACAVACRAATVFRNYFVNGTGQGHGKQIDCLEDVGELVGNSKNNYWRMVNGYCLPASPDSIGKLSARISSDPALAEAVRSRLRVGVHWDTEVTGKDHRVCQVFSSALPVAYAKKTPSKAWEPFGRLILDATFEATLAVGAILAAERGERVKVYLTAVGGGAFGNRTAWIVNAMEKALQAFAAAPLDVMLVSFSTLPRSAYAGLETPARRPKAKSAVKVEKPAGDETEAGESSTKKVASAEATGTHAEKIAAAFSRLDLNGDGVIDEAELLTTLQKLLPELSEESAKALFKAADSDSDGEIHYAEFSAWIYKEDAAVVASRILNVPGPK